MTAQPPQTFPPRMPRPDQPLIDALQHIGDGLQLLVDGQAEQTQLLQRLVELGEANKAALDAMQQPDPFSVQGLGKADDDDTAALPQSSSPFIGG